jgi:hypothetical protein
MHEYLKQLPRLKLPFGWTNRKTRCNIRLQQRAWQQDTTKDNAGKMQKTNGINAYVSATAASLGRPKPCSRDRAVEGVPEARVAVKSCRFRSGSPAFLQATARIRAT